MRKLKALLQTQWHPDILSPTFNVYVEHCKGSPLMCKVLSLTTPEWIRHDRAAFNKRMAFEKQIRRTVEIRWAYDGALNGGRDQPDWIKEVNDNLLMLFTGRLPPHFLLEALIDHPDTPWKVRLKAKMSYKAMELLHRYKNMREHKKIMLWVAVSQMVTLPILGVVIWSLV